MQNERGTYRKLTDWFIGDAPFGWFTSDRGIELRELSSIDQTLSEMNENLRRQNSGVVQSLVREPDSSRETELMDLQSSIGNVHSSLAKAQHEFEKANMRADALQLGIEDVRDLMVDSIYLQTSIADAANRGADELSLIRRLFHDKLTLLPESLVEELARNEIERLYLPTTIANIRRAVYADLNALGESENDEDALAAETSYHSAKLEVIDRNSADESAFLDTRSTELHDMILRLLATENQPDQINNETGKRALEQLVASETKQSEIKRQFEGKRRLLLGKIADFRARTGDKNLLTRVEAALGDQIDSLYTEEADAQKRAAESTKKHIEVLKNISGVGISQRKF